MNTVIKVGNLSKQYRLGEVGTGTIGHDLNRWWAKIRGKEDPFSTIGEVNDRTKKGNSEYVWALKDIDFTVNQGDVFGIIGRNGAGKSTLLKILSRTTLPTTGSLKAKGRIASLLEVGTGFHPELTGRENVFQNGALLGMTKKEIVKKFDEIVDFSGVERYIDTPVKRYSSGMYVRLAFAVAAHLESEILIVDEVLAVGDAEFQKKCLGKMGDMSKNEGRTVLLVSHNMSAINKLCNKGIYLSNGKIETAGAISDIIASYLETSKSEINTIASFTLDDKKAFQILNAKLVDKQGELITKSVDVNSDFFLEIEYIFKDELKKCNLTVIIQNSIGETVLFIDRSDYYKEYYSASKGKYKTILKIPNPLFKPESYYITLGINDMQQQTDDHKFEILKFKIADVETLRQVRDGSLFLPTQWEMISND